MGVDVALVVTVFHSDTQQTSQAHHCLTAHTRHTDTHITHTHTTHPNPNTHHTHHPPPPTLSHTHNAHPHTHAHTHSSLNRCIKICVHSLSSIRLPPYVPPLFFPAAWPSRGIPESSCQTRWDTQ